jgi:hypothetical protein
MEWGDLGVVDRGNLGAVISRMEWRDLGLVERDNLMERRDSGLVDR